ncbi:MAG: ATP-binding protein, partial [Verrucomicrobia bacterium]|nr:ATP-binding protein [Verrucomicrobiota bacterium]
VLMVGGRITGEPLNREELLLFHSLLENLGLYLRRSKSEALSSPVTEKGAAASGGPTDTTQQNQPIFNLLKDSYEEMPTAYLLVSQNDQLITANNAGRQLFNLVKENGHPLTTHQLPTALGHKISSVFSQSDDGLPIIVRLESPDSPILRCHVFPLKHSRYRDLPVVGVFVEQLKTTPPRETKSPKPEPASDDSTGVQPLIKSGKMDPSPMGADWERTVYDKLARQIHYALVPLSTHAHLLDHGHYDEDFRDSLSEVLHAGIGRFSRFSRQLSYMVRHQYDLSEKTEIRKLVQSAFDEALEYLEDPKATFELLDEESPAIVRCEEVAIKFALAEVFLNALQANIGKPQFLVKFARKSAANEPKGIEIIVRDMGDGFEPEALEKAFEPFFSTRPAGLGLGLSVARRILEGHFGHIHIRSTPAQNQHEVVIFLPTL